MEYNDQILHRLQQLELSVLDDFMKVCEENSFTWFAHSGTGLGALRHQGFIPWDDDIDVGLLRKDYDRLIQIFREQYADKYIVVNADEYPSYPLPTTRITIRDSLFVEDSLKNIKNCPLGIFLDVYAFDNAAPDPRAARKQIWKTWLYGKMMILAALPFPVLPFSGIKKKLFHVLTAAVWAVLKLFRVSPRHFFRKLKKTATRYNGQPTGAYVYANYTDPFCFYYQQDELFPLRMLPFEGRSLPFARDLEKHMERQYGNYMQLPPVEKRKNHFPNRLKFPGETTVYTAGTTE